MLLWKTPCQLFELMQFRCNLINRVGRLASDLCIFKCYFAVIHLNGHLILVNISICQNTATCQTCTIAFF